VAVLPLCGIGERSKGQLRCNARCNVARQAVLGAVGAPRRHIVQLNRFFTNVEADQDVVNRVQGVLFAGHLPTSASVEVKRLATDRRLRLEINAVVVA
jgi:enamine deaminase RidA (YjgF/YER057c/UK114 family)